MLRLLLAIFTFVEIKSGKVAMELHDNTKAYEPTTMITLSTMNSRSENMAQINTESVKGMMYKHLCVRGLYAAFTVLVLILDLVFM